MARKVFISFLGTSHYESSSYQFKMDGGDFNTKEETPFAQEATLEFLYSDKNPYGKWCKDDNHKAFVLCTDEATEYNWEASKEFKDGKDEYEEGLEESLSEYNVEKVHVDDYSDIWGLFKLLSDDLINDEDELYLDLTHGFRFMPMLLVVFANYVKFTRKAKIQLITYCNKETQEIINLLPLTQLQDWTYASASFIKNGNVKELQDLVSKSSDEVTNIVNLLSNVVRERQTCRGLSIHSSVNVKILKEKLKMFLNEENIKNLTDDKRPLKDIIEKVEESLEKIDDKDNFMNGFYAAKWCCDNGLYQQAITMLRESFVTYLCLKHNLNIKSEQDRYCAETALNVTADHIKESKWRFGKYQEEVVKPWIKQITKDALLLPIKREDGKLHNSNFVVLYKNIRDIRNTFNHNGMGEEPPSSSEIIEWIENYTQQSISMFEKFLPLCL